MPTFNRGGNNNTLLKRALDSILNQSYPYFELIVINDGSTDNTLEILKEYQEKDNRIHIINNKTNKGIVYALNQGLNTATGVYIARMDDDDISLPLRFKKQVAFLEKNKHIVATGCAIKIEGTNEVYSYPKNPKEAKILSFVHVPVAHPCTMIRTAFIKKHNIKYQNTYPLAEDLPFWHDVVLKHNGLVSNLDDILLIKKRKNIKSDPKSIAYMKRQNAIAKKYQENSFLYFLDKKECYNTCSCYRNLAKLNEFSDILKSNFVQKYIKFCPDEESIPLKKESVLYDYLILKENEGKLFLRNKSALVIEKQDNALTLQWKTTHQIEHYQYEKESGMFRLIIK